MILRDTKETFKVVKTELKNGTPTHSIIDLEDIVFNGKSVVCLSGNLTKKPENAIAYSANVYSWLAEHKKRNDVTFYSIFYPTEQPLETNLTQNMALDYRHFSKRLLLSAVRKNNEPLPVDEMIKNLSNITFFGHSAGGMVMDELIDYFIVFLKRHSFSKRDIQLILSNIVFVGYSPYKFVEAPIKGVYITPLYDSLGSSRKAIKSVIQENNFTSSNTASKKVNKLTNNCESHEQFIELYKPLLKEDKAVYFANKNSIFVLPDLLIDDGVIEDHNLAGVSENPQSSRYKTQAGIKTTEFLHQVFKYSLEKDRGDFDMYEIYDKATNNQKTEEVTNEI